MAAFVRNKLMIRYPQALAYCTCQMYQDERAGTLCWPKSRTHTSKLAQYMSDRGVT